MTETTTKAVALPYLRAYREAAGLTLAALGERLGVLHQQVYAWETGKREPLVSAALAIADALGTTVERLARGPAPGEE